MERGAGPPEVFRVDPETGLVCSEAEPVVLSSSHHDLRAALRFEHEFIHQLAVFAARSVDPGLVGDGFLPTDIDPAIRFLREVWPWAEFVDTTPAPDMRVFSTAAADPPASPPTPVMLSSGAIVCELERHQSPPGWVCTNTYRRRNKTGDIDRFRRLAHPANHGVWHLLPRRP